MKKIFGTVLFIGAAVLLWSCAGTRQGLVCEEIEYRLNTMTYSPDQRAYMEEELRVCREQEAEKKAAGAAQRQSIYDRFAASDSTQKKSTGDSTNTDGSASNSISVSEALHDSSGVKTQSIYDRYKSVEAPSDSAVADTSAADAASFQ